MGAIAKAFLRHPLPALLVTGPVIIAVPVQAAAEVSLPQLDVSTYASQIFWLIITFIILYVLTSKVAVPRISKVLEERQDRITDDLDRAESLTREAEQVQAAYEASLRDARDRAHAILRSAQEDIAAKAAADESEARERVTVMLQEAEAQIAAARAEATGDIRQMASGVTALAVARLTGLDIPEDRVERVVSQVIAEHRP